MHKALPYIISGAAIVALVFLTLVFFILNMARLNTIFSSTAEHLDPQKTSRTLIYDDPLITYVPDGDRSAEQKTNVFVSSQDPTLGSDDAKVYLILYGSLLDSTMQEYLGGMVELQAGYESGEVAVVWKDNADSDLARDAASVGHCANTLGRFWEYATALSASANGTEYDLASLKQVAIAQGVNAQELENCLSTSGVSAQVAQSTGLALPLGVTTTHSVFVNDDLYNDAISVEELQSHTDALLATF